MYTTLLKCQSQKEEKPPQCTVGQMASEPLVAKPRNLAHDPIKKNEWDHLSCVRCHQVVSTQNDFPLF